MKIEELRQSLGSVWDSMADGWDRLRQGAGGALTRFKPSDRTELPSKDSIDDALLSVNPGWAMLGGDVFEDEQRVVVRIEAPGLDKSDISVEVDDGSLVIRGEKRFEREQTEGRWRVMQCAYGAFSRTIALPAAVKGEQAKATYDKGVLKVELPKAEPAPPRKSTIPVN